jgi:hypothetical protein
MRNKAVTGSFWDRHLFTWLFVLVLGGAAVFALAVVLAPVLFVAALCYCLWPTNSKPINVWVVNQNPDGVR